MAKSDGSLIFDTKVDKTGLEKGVKGLGDVAKKAGLLAAKGIGVATAALGAFSLYATKAGSSFDAAMSEVGAISQASAKDLERLAEKAKYMGATTKFSATESAEALKYMAMAGWDTEKMLGGLSGVMNLAAASGEHLGTVSDIVTDAMTAFKMPAEQAGHFADVLAQAASNANTNVGMLGDSFKYVAPVAGALNYTIEDTALALGLMANSGVKSSIAGTALRQAMVRLVKPTRQTADGMRKLGITVDDFKGLSLRDVLNELRVSFSELDEAQKAEAAALLFGQEAMSGMLAIINTSDEDFNKLATSIDNSTGAAERMATVMQDNLKGDITILKSAVEGLGIAFYEGLDSPLRDITKRATGYVGELANSLKTAEQIKEELMKGGMDASQAQFEVDNMGIVGGFEGIAKAFGDILAKVINDIASYAPQIIKSGVDLLNSFVDGLLQNKDSIAQGMLEALGSFVVGAGEFLPRLVELGVGLVESLASGLTSNPQEMMAKGIEIITNICDSIIAAVPVLGRAAIGLLVALAQGLAANLPTLIAEVPRIINEFASAIYDLLPMLLIAAGQIMWALGTGLIQAIPTLIKNLPQIFLAIVNVITLMNWASIGKSAMTKLKGGLESMGSALKNAALKLMELVKTGLKDLLTNAPQIAKNGMTKFGDGMKSMGGWLKDQAVALIKKAIDGFKSKFAELPQVGKDLLNGIVNGIAENAGLVFSKMKEVAQGALDSVKNFFKINSPSKRMRDEVGKPIPQGIAVGIIEEQRTLNDAIIAMSKEALDKALKKASSYEEIGKIYAETMSKGVKKHVDISIKAVNSLVDESMKALAAGNKKAKAEYVKAGKEVSTAYAKAIKDGISKVQEEITAEVQRITQEAQAQYDKILAQKDDLERKIGDFGELFTIDQESGEAIISNLNNQIDAIKRYDEVLTNLKSKGASNEFMNEVTKLGVDEGTKFGQALLKLSDDQFKQYEANWQEKQRLAKEFAMKFYKDQLDALQSDFVNKLDKSLKSVPAIVQNIGVSAIQGMIQGMDGQKSGAVSKAREIADAVIAEMARALDINSPSRVAADLIGRNIPKGVMVGMDEEQRNLLNRIRGMVDLSKMELGAKVSASVNGASGTRVITNNNDNGVSQTIVINTPVKSPIEMMREAKRSAKELAYA